MAQSPLPAGGLLLQTASKVCPLLKQGMQSMAPLDTALGVAPTVAFQTSFFSVKLERLSAVG